MTYIKRWVCDQLGWGVPDKVNQSRERVLSLIFSFVTLLNAGSYFRIFRDFNQQLLHSRSLDMSIIIGYSRLQLQPLAFPFRRCLSVHFKHHVCESRGSCGT